MPGLIGIRNHLNLAKNHRTGVFNPYFHGSVSRKQATHLRHAKAHPRVALDIGPHTPRQSSMDIYGMFSLVIYKQGGFKEWLTFEFCGEHPEWHPLKVSPD